ncbi:hypothetical protein KSP40_PGU021642 [Platanthera guangdongensis]|uniref:Uncharacterized protein n=1 Tax=Platanthera guangdongensis TaxID=2320717 RepID=A0ABR2MX72_9ASPA
MMRRQGASTQPFCACKRAQTIARTCPMLFQYLAMRIFLLFRRIFLGTKCYNMYTLTEMFFFCIFKNREVQLVIMKLRRRFQ